MKKLTLALGLALIGLITLAAQGAGSNTAADSDAAIVKLQLPSYPLKTCVISGEDLGSMGDAIDHVVVGRLVRVCCKGCIKKVVAKPAAAIAKVDAAVIAAQKPGYPLDTCIISGKKLGSKGAIIDLVEGTRLVRLCCKGCKVGYAANKASMLGRIDTALIEKQKLDYPLAACPISGEGLASVGKPVDLLHGVTLVRLCCGGCKKSFAKNPQPVLDKIQAARKAAASKAKVEKKTEEA